MSAELPSSPVPQTEAWLGEYKRQRRTVYRPALNFARKRTQGDDLRSKELVEEALTDTLYNIVKWDPAHKPLPKHIIDVIRWRTKNEFQRNKRFVHEPYDTCEAGDETAAAYEVSRARVHVPTHDEAVREAYEMLRGLALGDVDVTAWLDAVHDGAMGPADVMHVTKMTSTRFHAARERLRRIAQDMPNQLWLAAQGRS